MKTLCKSQVLQKLKEEPAFSLAAAQRKPSQESGPVGETQRRRPRRATASQDGQSLTVPHIVLIPQIVQTLISSQLYIAKSVSSDSFFFPIDSPLVF